jgi:hypothetical protein
VGADLGAALGQFRRARQIGDAVQVGQGLGAHGADRAGRGQQIEDSADQQAADQADRHVALRILGLFGRGRDGVEADVGEEDRGRGAQYACAGRAQGVAPASRGERLEVVHVAADHRHGDDDEHHQRRHLHRHEYGVDRGAFLGAEHQEARHQGGDDHRRQVDEAARLAAFQEGADGDLGPDCQGVGYVYAHRLQEADYVARPAYGHGAGAEGIFEDQGPADEPGDQFAHDGVGVGVGRARDGDHRGQFGIAERGDRADRAGDDEGDHHAWAGLLGGGGGENEDTGADDGPDPEHDQLNRAQRSVQGFLFRCRQDRVERLNAPHFSSERRPPGRHD